MREALEKAAADDSIKAVVLRIDSPGGSATASEIILDATRRVKAKKPLVVSMGDVAGSGGYYVACAADTIFADATTLTGSIGVVAGKTRHDRDVEEDGHHLQGVQTRTERRHLLDRRRLHRKRARPDAAFMDDIYAVFKRHVTEIRGDRLEKADR